MEKLIRIKRLIKQLNEYRDSYYNEARPVVSDAAYDRLFDELSELEKDTGIVYANSPTQTVGYVVKSELEKVKHSHPMLSLDKTKSVDDLVKFAGEKDCILSLKMDGCFVGDTRITMADGSYKKIKDIEVGDEVMSFNENTFKITPQKVVNTYKNGLKENKQWMKIGLFSDAKSGKYKISVTKNHLIMTNNGWKKAIDIKIGDIVYYYDYELTESQKSVILGFSLGDGTSLKRVENNYGMEYRYSKTDKFPHNIMFYKVASLFDGKFGRVRHRKSGFGYDMLDCHIKKIRDIPKEYYSNNNLLRCGYTFTEEILSCITPLALAVYYIDDGSRCPSKDDGYTKAVNIKTRCILHTNRHNTDDVHRFSKFLSTFMGIENTVRKEKEVKTKNGGSGLIIQLSDKGTEKFFDIIAPYIPKELRKIKLGLKEKWQEAECIEWWNDSKGLGLIQAEVKYIQDGIFPENSEHKSTMSYDLEIENNHTYFANNFAVHNCTTMLTYENGELVQAETRGDGEVGELITHNAKVFDNIPLTIDYKGHFEIEGEAIITYDDFNKINEFLSDDKKYKNPRNLASGSVRQLDSKIASQRHIKFIAWKVPTEVASNSFINRLQYAAELGFDTVPFLPIRGNSNAEFINIVIEQLQRRANERNFPIDGLVATYNDITYGESLGMTGHHPKHSIAFKFYDEEVETVLKNIEWSMGKIGSLTPVAIFDPVEIDGTMVERASLHNVSILTKLDLQIGDTIIVYKANQIIPQVKENLSAKDRESAYIRIPSQCPVCESSTQIVKENDSEVLMCTNPHCKGKLLGRVSHFVSKKGMDISGLSEETIKKFIELGWIAEITDVYNLEQHYDRLSTMSGFGRKSVDKLRKSIENSKTVRLDKFITSLSIPGIGTSQSRELVKVFNTWDDFRDASVGCYNFTQIDGFGDVLNKNIHSWFKDMCGIADNLASLMTFEAKEKQNADNSLDGKSFVVTGKVFRFKNRDEVKTEIEKRGGKVTGSVTKSTYALINNDIESNSSKNKKAKELGVQIINEEQLMEMLGM
jgi:DNA ligase (NAD+)